MVSLLLSLFMLVGGLLIAPSAANAATLGTGYGDENLQRILGHASIETTKGYLHPDHRQLNEAAKLANQFLARPSTTREEPQQNRPSL